MREKNTKKFQEEKTMKKRNRSKILSLLLSAILFAGIIPTDVLAASSVESMQMYVRESAMENPDVVMYGNPNENNMSRDASYLINCNISAAYMSYGLYIQTETGTKITASELGVKDIKVQQKNGIFWTTIATSGGGSITNDDWFLGSCDCKNAVSGEIYRIKCTHFAYIGGNYYHYDHTSDSFTYVKP